MIDAQSLRVGGRISLLGGLIRIDGSAVEDWNRGTISVSGTETLLNGLVTATGTATISSNLDLETGGDATVHIPAGAPYFAGTTLANGKFQLTYVNDDDPTNDFVEVSGTLGPLQLGLRVYFDGSWAPIGGIALGPATAGAAAASVAAAVPPTGQTFTVPAGTQWALLTADWQNDSPSAQLRLVTTSGAVLTEADILADPSMQIVDEMTTPTSRSVLVNNPTAGAWNVSVADATGLGSVEYHALRDGPQVSAAFAGISGGQGGAPVNVRVGLNDPSGQARVALYYDNDAAGQVGVLIAGGLSAPAGVLNYTWTPKDVPPGQYFLYAVVTHPDAPSAVVYAPAPVQITAAPPAPSVIRRHVFYAGSVLDRPAALDSAPDEHAIGRDKIALLPGQAASFSNITSYSRGINGLMVDLANLPQDATVGASDFSFRVGTTAGPSGWSPGPAPATVSLRRGEGLGGSDRVVITWADNLIRNTWLQATVLADSDTGLAKPDVVYFGNLVGDTGIGAGGVATVDPFDVAAVRRNLNATDPVAVGRYDVNRDGVVNAIDVALVRNNQRHTLASFTAPAAAAPAAAASFGEAPVPPMDTRVTARPPRRGLFDDPPASVLA